jgi:hypothetical protein
MAAPKKIRIDAGRITLDDMRTHPSWEFCLDEEGDDDQSECTIRPFKPKASALRLSDYCLVVCDFVARDNTPFLGWITLGTTGPTSPWDFTPELLLEGVDGAVASHPDVNGVPSVVITTEATTRVGFYLPQSRSHRTEAFRSKIDFAYQLLGTTPEALFPILVNPHQTIKKWPDEFKIDGFYRPTDEGLPPIR